MKHFKLVGFLLVIAMSFVLSSCDSIRLKADVAASNEDCPIYIDEGMVCTKIQLKDDYVEYVVNVDEEIGTGYDDSFTVDDYDDPAIKEVFKLAILEEFRNPESISDYADYQEFLDLCRSCKVGIRWKLVGNTTGHVSFINIEYWEF